jgi:hypothetical protein
MAYPIPYDNWTKHKGPIALYGIFTIKDGVLMGYVEHSFSMSFSPTQVRIWSKKNAIGIFNKDFRGKNHDSNAFIVRLTRNSGPIICDFKQHDAAIKNKCKKFEGRNIEFKSRPRN